MKTLQAPANPLTRMKAFADAFFDAPNDADIEIRLGMTAAHEPALLVTINGDAHAMTVKEARAVANIMEQAMKAHPNEPEAKTLPNTILGLRAACDKADRGFR